MGKRVFSVFLLLIPLVGISQISVDNTSMTVEQYIQNVLIGQGVAISNVQFNAGPANLINEQVGKFIDSNLHTGLPYGIILGTGNVQLAAQANLSGGESLGGGTGVGSDSALASITPNTIFDECVVEFDFVPVGDTIKFNYVFASEEYDEYVCGMVNDAFGFFLTGPNPNGGIYNIQNIALVPNPNNPSVFTNTPVSINTINLGVAGVNGNLTNCTNIDSNFASYNVFYVQNPTNNYEYDGNTIVLQARAAVVCGQTYHIKLAIGDAGDGAFDSGVFIEGGSFSSNGIQVDVVTTTGDSAIVEGCNSAEIRFIRPNSTDSLVVHYSLNGSTAINGVDYVTIADSVLFVPGVDTMGVTIIPIADGIVEGTEVISITAYTVSPCGDTILSTGNIYIMDTPDMQTVAPDTILLCPVDSIWVWATVSQATPPFHYIWVDMNGDTIGDSSSVRVSGLNADTFLVYITDSCQTITKLDTVIITTHFLDFYVQTSDTNICRGDTIVISAHAFNGYPPYSYSWSNGVNGQSSIVVSPSSPSVYYVSVSDSCNFTVKVDSVVVRMDYTPMQLSVSNDTLICAGDTISIGVYVQGGVAPYKYLWQPINSTIFSPTVSPTTSTVFKVSVTDLCMDTTLLDSVVVSTDFPPISLTTSDIPEQCIGDVVRVSGQIEGGKPPYANYWQYADISGTGHEFEFLVSWDTISPVIFIVTDDCGIRDSLIVPFVANDCIVDGTNIFTPNGDGENDFFKIRGVEFFPDNHLTVYNRWGVVVYEDDNYHNNWNGNTFSGKMVASGVYYYVFEYSRKGKSGVIKGTITVSK